MTYAILIERQSAGPPHAFLQRREDGRFDPDACRRPARFRKADVRMISAGAEESVGSSTDHQPASSDVGEFQNSTTPATAAMAVRTIRVTSVVRSQGRGGAVGVSREGMISSQSVDRGGRRKRGKP
jgi:hypothetical protein